MRIAPLVIVSLLLAAPVASAQTVDRSESTALVAWINEARAARHLAPLASDARLAAIAEAHSNDMARAGYFSHQSPTTGTVEDRAAAATFRWRALGENIAFNQSTRAAHEALLRSPGHYANITGNYRAVGVGLVRARDGVYVTEVFATPLDAAQTAPSPQPVAPALPAMQPIAPPSAMEPIAPPPAMQPAAPQGAAPDEGDTLRPAPGMRVRNCEVDTPFGHVSISIAGTGIDLSALPCNPDATRPSARPDRRAPNAPRVRGPGRHAVPRVDVPPVPAAPEVEPSSEPLGATIRL